MATVEYGLKLAAEAAEKKKQAHELAKEKFDELAENLLGEFGRDPEDIKNCEKVVRDLLVYGPAIDDISIKEARAYVEAWDDAKALDAWLIATDKFIEHLKLREQRKAKK